MDEVKAWLKRDKEVAEVLRIIPLREGPVRVFVLQPAYELGASSLGRILFDAAGYWIYDGDELRIAEQEQMASFILKSFFSDANLGRDE